jgi:membrane protein YdbS with pleckstrin-like domain
MKIKLTKKTIPYCIAVVFVLLVLAVVCEMIMFYYHEWAKGFFAFTIFVLFVVIIKLLDSLYQALSLHEWDELHIEYLEDTIKDICEQFKTMANEI